MSQRLFATHKTTCLNQDILPRAPQERSTQTPILQQQKNDGEGSEQLMQQQMGGTELCVSRDVFPAAAHAPELHVQTPAPEPTQSFGQFVKPKFLRSKIQSCLAQTFAAAARLCKSN